MIKVVNSIKQWQEIRSSEEFKGKAVGLVPTMGALHEGHLSLFRRSKKENDITVGTIFVNPTQFSDPKDLDSYPVDTAADIYKLKALGVDLVIVPDFADLYPDVYAYKISESKFSKSLCGRHRPGHFDGVLTVVLKLFNLVKPNRAYFGEKDFQQLSLIRNMVQAFFLDIDIVACPIVREDDGLAMSSRNRLLNPEQRALAKNFQKLLSKNLPCGEIEKELKNVGFDVDYVQEDHGRRFGAVRVGNVRLIDNIQI